MGFDCAFPAAWKKDRAEHGQVATSSQTQTTPTQAKLPSLATGYESERAETELLEACDRNRTQGSVLCHAQARQVSIQGTKATKRGSRRSASLFRESTDFLFGRSSGTARAGQEGGKGAPLAGAGTCFRGRDGFRYRHVSALVARESGARKPPEERVGESKSGRHNANELYRVREEVSKEAGASSRR